MTKIHYCTSLKCRFLNEHIQSLYGKESIFDIDDLKILRDIYDFVNLHPRNIAQHRNISCALMRYIRFLNNGKKYIPTDNNQNNETTKTTPNP